ncbi:MAG: Holliday junction branch migration protein RuvA [Acidobacteriota bacterium]
MIARLSGTLFSKQPNHLVVDVNGVGYELVVPLSTYYEVGEPGTAVQLLVYTHVREDILALFGFKTAKEKEVFEHLTSVSGIGPKLGVTILSGMSVEELVPAICQGNLSRLTSIPGVGKKTAERLVVELRDKLSKLTLSSEDRTALEPSLPQQQEDVLSALVNLGYAKPQAERAVQKVLSSSDPHLSFEIILKKTLQELTR